MFINFREESDQSTIKMFKSDTFINLKYSCTLFEALYLVLVSQNTKSRNCELSPCIYWSILSQNWL